MGEETVRCVGEDHRQEWRLDIPYTELGCEGHVDGKGRIAAGQVEFKTRLEVCAEVLVRDDPRHVDELGFLLEDGDLPLRVTRNRGRDRFNLYSVSEGRTVV